MSTASLTSSQPVSTTFSLPYLFNAEQIIEEGRVTRSQIETIKQWLNTTNFPKFCDELVVLFLLSCDNVIEATQNTITAYFKYKYEAPEIFNNRDVDQEILVKTMNVIVAASLPVRLNSNDVIHYFKLQDTNYSNFDLIESMKVAYMIIDISHRINPPDGLIVLMDMKGVGFMHLTKFRLEPIKKFLKFLQEAMPLKLKAIYILNANYIAYKVLDLVKMLIKSEVLKMLKLFPCDYDMEDFTKNYIPWKCLPKEYGGELPTTAELNQKTIEQLRELKQFFVAEENMRKLYTPEK